jgi:hypothetical protein
MLTADMLRRLMTVAAIVSMLAGVLVVECKAAAGAYPRYVAQNGLNF